jgi:hypothetical protein
MRFCSRTIVVSVVLLQLANPAAVYAAFTSTVAAGVATMTGDAGSDTLVITEVGGLLRHNRFDAGDPGFNSATDFDSSVGGDQQIALPTGSVNINAGDGNDTIVIAEGINVGGTIDGGLGTDTIDYSAYTAAISANLGLGSTGLSATLDGEQENPPTTHAGTGTATVTNYNVTTRTFDIAVNVLDLPPADVIGFHIHQAPVGVNGPIIIDFGGAASLVPSGTGFTFTATGVTLPAASEAAFLGGGTYVNIHTPTFTGGAIRGQLFSNANANLTTGTATGAAAIANIENVTGGAGNDSLVGNNLPNTLNGGPGADWIVAGPGSDILDGGAGADVLVWSNGDGTDIDEGGADSDTVQVNGSTTANDVFEIRANGTRIDFDRISPGPFSLDIGTVETLIVNGIGGNDTFTVFDLSGVASLTTLNLNGFAGDDVFTFAPVSGSVAVTARGGAGNDTNINPPTSANDAYVANFNTPFPVAAPGVLANDNTNGGGGMTAALVSSVSNGNLLFNTDGSFVYTPNVNFVGTDSFTYRATNTAGSGNVASVTITVIDPNAPQPPSGFMVSSIVGNVVTFRWTPPAIGPPPAEYLLEGGINPGQVLASIATGSPSPIFTVAVPTGAFYARVHSLYGGARSAPSNEILFFVNLPVPPSAPVGLVGVVNDYSVELAWRNTFGGGETEALILDVSGSLSASVPLGRGETANFPSVPGGSYTFSLRAANAAGISGPSNAIALSVPSACSGAPLPPENFLAYKIGNTAYVVWDPAATGPASTGYVLHVSGGFTLTLPTNQRTLSGAVPPGTYNLSVSATNVCGSSAPTPVQTVVIP